MRFTDQVALITAAASGIGKATAEIVGREGGIVVGVDTDQGRLEKVVASIRDAGARAHGVPADALDPHQVQRVVDAVVREHRRIDILVNAVGGSTIVREPAATVDTLTLEDWQRLIDFNLTGTFLFCHAVTPVMKRQGVARSSTSRRSRVAVSARAAAALTPPPRAASSP